MSLWWAKKEQLDEHQIALIEDLGLKGHHTVLGPPGSGKTNVLLRRAQFIRSQNMPNVMTLTYTRALAEFVKTGCYDARAREIFPVSCVSTIEAWVRRLYREHKAPLPPETQDLVEWKRTLARGAIGFSSLGQVPKFDGLFVDECQDLMSEEIELLSAWGENLFFVGDDRQKIYEKAEGLEAINTIVSNVTMHRLPFHYRLAPEICEVADRIQVAGPNKLASTSHYDGPRPGRVEIHGPLDPTHQIEEAAIRLKQQLRAYGDLIKQGDRLGVIVPRTAQREEVLTYFEQDPDLAGRAQIVRANDGTPADRGRPMAFDDARPILILTVQGSKGLEFRAAHWLFADELRHHFNLQHYYTIVTRAKTSLDIMHGGHLPDVLARACPTDAEDLWG